MTSLARTVLAVALLVALLVAEASLVVAQAPAGSPAEVARTFAGAWGRGDGSALEPLLAAGGLSLSLDGPAGHVAVSPRQVAASIDRFLDQHDPAGVTVRRTQVLGGDPPRALAELEWSARPQGTRDVASRVIFLGLEQIGGRWIVVEIRLLP